MSLRKIFPTIATRILAFLLLPVVLLIMPVLGIVTFWSELQYRWERRKRD